LAVCLLPGAAGAQHILDVNRLARQTAPAAVSVPTVSAPPAKLAAKGEWSGEDGASGHPLMRAQAIRIAAANFRSCIDRMWALAARRGVSRATFDAATAPLEPDLRIMDLVDRQPEFTRPPWEYIDALVNETRIQKGREMLATHRALFDAVERTYGVDRHVMAAIWGIESNFGLRPGDRPVLQATATLACIGRRQVFFRDEFLAALEIVQRGDVRPADLRGSWAGAFGATQFMPTAFKRFAVDFDGDGRRDTINSPPDIVASTANMLKRSGWRSGESWGYEVTLPSNFNFLLADRGRLLSLDDWQRLGIRRASGLAFPRASDRAFLLLPAGAGGPAFLMLPNFRVIMRYNPAEAYALAIGHLADRLRGGEAFAQEWPRAERVLSRSERYELQQLLSARGYDIGVADGRLSGKTQAAVRHFQSAVGRAPDGFATASLLELLRRR
jgi:lytic murein transglycosylase